MMRQHQRELTVETRGQSLVEITGLVAETVAEAAIAQGLAVIMVRHTSASLLVQEHADPDVRRDLLAFLRRLVPDGDPLFIHGAEGPDDMPAHVKAALTQTSLAIPVAAGRLVLGTWQGIYLIEHRSRPHRRHIFVHVMGE